MGIYLNPNNASFLTFVNTGRYIDKTMLIAETNKRLNDRMFDFICVNRPRRFGKSIAEDMLVAYYSKGADSKALFAPYKIARTEHFEKHLNKFNVVKIDLNAMFSKWKALSEQTQTKIAQSAAQRRWHRLPESKPVQPRYIQSQLPQTRTPLRQVR